MDHSEDEEASGLNIFQEPTDFYQPEKPPTYVEYALQDGRALHLRLVGHSPLWGHLLWNAGQVVAKYLENNAKQLVQNKTVLELGAGAGLPSLVAAILGARQVVVTDYPEKELIVNLQYNIEHCSALKNKSSIVAEGFLWGSTPAALTSHLQPGADGFDLLILADILFNHSEHAELLSTVRNCLKKTPDSVALVFFTPYRPWLLDKDLSFFNIARADGFVVDKISEQVMDKVMFEEDPGDEALRKTVFGYENPLLPVPTSWLEGAIWLSSVTAENLLTSLLFLHGLSKPLLGSIKKHLVAQYQFQSFPLLSLQNHYRPVRPFSRPYLPIMPIRAHLKQLWETKIASCFGDQTAQKGDEPTREPVAPSRVSSSDTRPIKTSEVIASYPFFPIFLITLFIIHLCATHATAHAIHLRSVDHADHLLAHDTSATEMVSAVSTKAPEEEHEARNNGMQGNSGAGFVPAWNAGPSLEGQESADGGTGPTSQSPDNNDVRRENDAWVVPNAGKFTKRAVYTFGGSTLPAGLTKSNYTVQCRESQTPNRIPYNERFDPTNVQLSNGFLTLTVPGGQAPSRRNNYAVSSAEVTTTEQNILYGSFRTNAIFSGVPGTCQAIFFYKSDTQEIDIEYLSDPSSQSNNGPGMPVPFWYTNQAVDPENMDKTSQSGPAPQNCTTCVHEYRIDWTKDFTAFYIDGQRQRKFTANVPSKPGPFVWNNWANGDQGWSVGPPAQDNVFQIKNITMYYNTAKDRSSDTDSMQEAGEAETKEVRE